MPASQRREQLLDVALATVAEGGLGALSIDGVARAAGITRPVVYAAFGDLEGLIHALIDREEQNAFGQVAAALPAVPSERHPDELLVDGLLAFLTAVRTHPQTWRLILYPLDGAPPASRARLALGRDRLLSVLTPMVGWGLARRGGPLDLDTELIARMIVSTAEEAARLLLADPGRYPPERFAGLAAAIAASLGRASTPGSPRG